MSIPGEISKVERELPSRLSNYVYYLLIAGFSAIALIFLPMIGTNIGIKLNLPNTKSEWIIWSVLKGIIVVINMLIFHCFVRQAKLNIKDDPRYLRALEMLNKAYNKKDDPRSPAKYFRETYGGKGTSVFIFTLLSVFALSSAILTYDYIALITYVFTIIMGIFFGLIQMKSVEAYWTEEFPRYAEKQYNKEDHNDHI